MGGGRSRPRHVNSMWTIQNLVSMEMNTRMDLSLTRNTHLQRRRNLQRPVRLCLLVRERRKAMQFENRAVPTILLKVVGNPKMYNAKDEEEDDGGASDVSAPRDEIAPPQIIVSPSKFLPSSKPLSAIATYPQPCCCCIGSSCRHLLFRRKFYRNHT
jgi:hypothetical protein